MATRVPVATETFTYADGVLDTVSSGRWRQVYAFFGNDSVASNQFNGGNANTGRGNRYQGVESFTADQYAKAVFQGPWTFGGAKGRVMARVSAEFDDGGGSTRDFYAVTVFDDAPGDPASRTVAIEKMINGTLTTLASASKSWGGTTSTSDIEVEGTTIRAMKDSADYGTPLSTTDSDLSAAENPGIGGGNNAVMDDWEGGNLVTIAALGPPLLGQLIFVMP